MTNLKAAQKNPTWTGMLPVDDTALAVTDTGGPGTPVIYLNGHFGSQRQWKRVIADLGPGYRHISFDARARGRSKLSADYSFEACVRDIDAVLAARGVDRPLLVGWSYGALLHDALEPILVNLPVPVRYVVASGEGMGSRDDLQEQMRKALDPLLDRNPKLKVSAKVGSNHGTILRKDSPAVADAVRELAAPPRDKEQPNR